MVLSLATMYAWGTSESDPYLWQTSLSQFELYCVFSRPPPPLLALPAELRNHIWELVCSPLPTDANSLVAGQYVELQNAARFTANLLAVCRQIHEEARGFFYSVRGQYWRESAFVLNYTTSVTDGSTSIYTSALDAVNEVALSNIQHLTIQGSIIPRDRSQPLSSLQFENGIWRRTYALRGQRASYEEYMVLVSKEVVKMACEKRRIPIRCPARFERIKGQTLYCRAISALQNNSRYADEDGKFHALCANISENNGQVMRVIAEEMYQKTLTRGHLEGNICAHVHLCETM